MRDPPDAFVVRQAIKGEKEECSTHFVLWITQLAVVPGFTVAKYKQVDF